MSQTPFNYKDEMKLLDKFLFWVGGVNDEMLRKGEITDEDENTLKVFSFFVIVSVCLAFSGAYFLAQFVLPTPVSIGVGLFWSLVLVLRAERNLFKNQKINAIIERVALVFVSATVLSVATSFYFAQETIQSYIKDKNVEYNRPLDSLYNATMQRQNQDFTELQNKYNGKIDDQRQAINDAQNSYSSDVTISETQKARLGELRRTLKDTEERYKKDQKSLQDRQKIEMKTIESKVKNEGKVINVAKLSERELFAAFWEIPRSPMNYFFIFLMFVIEFMPCIIRIVSQNCLYLQEVSQFSGQKRNANGAKRNQKNQNEDINTPKNEENKKRKAPSFEDEY
jgi:Domain of unknown function (DUF4407)